MGPYLLLAGLPGALALVTPRNRSWLLAAIVGAVFVIFIGFRYRVGMDWSNYVAIHQALSGVDFDRVLQGSDIASRALMWMSSNYLDGMATSNLIGAIVLIAGVIAVALRTREPWIALLAATPYLCIVIGMSGLRQSIAIGLFFLAVANWRSMSPVVKAAIIGVASLFHTSAVLMMALLMLTLELRAIWKIAVIVIIVPLGLYYVQQASSLTTSFDAYSQNYLSVEGRIDSPGALSHVALVAIPGLVYLLVRRRLDDATRFSNLMLYAAWAAVLLVPVALIFSTAASRISLYFQFVPMMLWPALIQSWSPSNRLMLRIVLVGGYIAYLVLWFVTANSSHAYIPYTNTLFGLR